MMEKVYCCVKIAMMGVLKVHIFAGVNMFMSNKMFHQFKIAMLQIRKKKTQLCSNHSVKSEVE